MIRSIYRDALASVQKAEQEITLEPANAIAESYQMTEILRNLLAKLKEHVLEKGFEDENEEITFFKEIKPQILGKLIYYNKVFRIESACPVGTGKMYQKYFANELQQLRQEYKEHHYGTEFYRYHKLGRNDRDRDFFLLGKIDLHNGLDSFFFETDPHFSTYYDYKVSRLLSNELLYHYLLYRISPDEQHNVFSPDMQSAAGELLWTSSKNALIELIYALHASGSISHGKLGIRKISAVFQMLFRVKLGDIHHAFHRMKDRNSSRSIFLDQLTSSLHEHMDKEL